MRRMVFPMMVVSLAMLPAALEAQTHGGQRGAEGARAQVRAHAGMAARIGQGADPVARLLAQREALGLTSDQVHQLEAVRTRLQAQNQPLAEQLQAARGQFGGERPLAGRPGMMAQRGQRMQQRGATMTPEQRAEMQARMQQRGAAMTPEQRAEMQARMQQRGATMTPEQRAEMQARMQQRMSEVRGERSERPQISEEQRAQVAALRPVAAQLHANQAQARADIMSILTTEQRVLLQDQQRTRAGRVRERLEDARGQRSEAGMRGMQGARRGFGAGR